MRGSFCQAVAVLLVLTAAAGAQQPAVAPGKVLKENWEAIYINNAKIGQVHLLCREVTKGASTWIQSSQDLELNARRFSEDLKLKISIADYADKDGKILTFGYQQFLNNQQNLLHTGQVQQNQVAIKTKLGNNPEVESNMAWDQQTIGLYREALLLKDHKLVPNTSFDYLLFVPDFKHVFRFHVDVEDAEEVALLQGEKKRLLRVKKQVTERVQGTMLPVEFDWVDDTGDSLKRAVEMPPFGTLTFYKTTEAGAKARNDPTAVDLGLNQMVRVSTIIPRPEASRQVVYKVRLSGVDEPGKAFASDDRQKIQNLQGEQMEIVVDGLVEPPANAASNAPVPKDLLKSNHFLRSDDPKVRNHAVRAVGSEADPWEKAKRIQHYVFSYVRTRDLTQTFATADEVARSMDGDCRQHAVLAAAMCRAAGIPARTAIGLVHVPQERAMIFHMWIEVWIAGKWYALDPTRGDELVAADHLKIADQDWNNELTLKPFLAVFRVLGKLQIDVGSVK